MSCFLLFVTLKTTFRIAKIERKGRLWAGVVDLHDISVPQKIDICAGARLAYCTCAHAQPLIPVFSDIMIIWGARVGPSYHTVRVGLQTTYGCPCMVDACPFIWETAPT